MLVWAKSRIARAGLEAIVRADPRFEVVVNAGGDLRSAMGRFNPDVVLLDGTEGGAIRGLQSAAGEAAAGPAVVALTGTARRPEIVRALQSGVRGVIARESHPSEITAALQAASDGLAVMSPEVLDVLLPQSHDLEESEALSLDEPLTARETEVLTLLAGGAGNKEIATRLGISEHTAKFHVSSILAKLGAGSRAEAVARGYREGLILI